MATPTATNPTPSIANVDGDAHFADRIVAVSGDAPRTIHDPGVRSALEAPTAHAGRDPTRLPATWNSSNLAPPAAVPPGGAAMPVSSPRASSDSRSVASE